MSKNFNIDLSNLNVIKTEDEQFNEFFYSGHPLFLIPSFNDYPVDIWLGLLDYLETEYDKKCWDQDGGEITFHKIIDKSTGLTECVYEAYQISFDEDEIPKDYTVIVTGYVVQDLFNPEAERNSFVERNTHFIAHNILIKIARNTNKKDIL